VHWMIFLYIILIFFTTEKIEKDLMDFNVNTTL